LAQALKSRTKKSKRRVIRKGRPASQPASLAGRDADGPRDGRDDERDDGRADQFDPFESFDAHDQAEGRGPSGRRTSSKASPSDAFDFPSSPASSDSPAETVYTRSRRAPGESSTADKDRADKPKGPVRSLKGRALGYLSRREYSRAELSRKLMPFAEVADSLEGLLDALEKEGWLSDSRFAESLIHRRASRLGASRIVGELKRHAVGQNLIEEASAQLRETELARAQAVWNKKYGQLPETPAERARQARFLAARGFSGATIGKILKGLEEDWAGE
jgi:regulatory protein